MTEDPEILSDKIIARTAQTVTRRSTEWTQSTQDLLRHLHGAGFAEAPRALGLNAGGDEILSYIEGESGPDAWAKIVPEHGLRSFARLLRRFHDAVRDYRPTTSLWATEPHVVGDDEIITHGDFGPWNTVWRGREPVGVIDWEMAGPRRPMFDVAYAIEYSAPFRDDDECTRWLGYPEPPDRRRRVALFADGYGLDSSEGLYQEVVSAQRRDIDYVQSLASRHIEPQASWVRDGYLVTLRSRVDWSVSNRHLFR